MLKIAFNAVPLLSPLTGIGRYTKQLLMGLDDCADVDVHKFYAASWSAETRLQPLPVMANRWKGWFKKWVPDSYQHARALQQKFFTKGVESLKPSLYHEPNFLAYEFDGPSVITVHDLSWIRYPQMQPQDRVRAMDKYFEPGLRRASRILTDSHFVKQELIDVFAVSPHIIHPVHLGVERQYRPHAPTQTQTTLTRWGLQHGQYLLAVGTLEPRKNLQSALRAFMAMPQACRKQYPLVLVGMKGWRSGQLEKQMSPLLAAGEIIQLGYLSRDDLIQVTAGACAMVYPSVYEGFGLPPLEAMACAVPVIASNVSSIPEVVGDSGLLVDPEDVDQLTQSMLILTQAPDVREGYAQQALARSRLFSWEQCARETMSVYRAAVA
jgi:glycosyltransferase involved in cell wall biosynthesis